MFDRIKKGVSLFKMAFEKTGFDDEQRILHEIAKFRATKRLEWMQTGIRYYDVDNDYVAHGSDIARPGRADNRLVHATYKNIVDEKVSYAFSKQPTLKTAGAAEKTQQDEAFMAATKKLLGKYWEYELESLGYEASNKGIAWLHPYLNDAGEFKMFVPPSEQVIPIWQDSSHFRLSAVIRVYEESMWAFGKEETHEVVELWTKTAFRKYKKAYGVLIELETGLQGGHFLVDGKPQAWGKVPFVPFKNNRRELPDIKFVKSLVDNYDLSRSEVANYIQEVTNYLMVVRGYDVDAGDELREAILKHRLVVLDEDGGVDALTPTLDITAAKEHYERTFKDIKDSGQAVDKSLDHFGAAPSGIALQFLYSGLDLKCSAIESEFRRGFDGLMSFIVLYHEIQHMSLPSDHDIQIVFNRNVTIDEASEIESAGKSQGMISDETIIAKHPWVTDVEAEMARLAAQKEEAMARMPDLAPVLTEEEDDDA